MKKFKLFLNIIKEEKWLNEQLQEGYLCTNINGLGIYSFKKTNKKYVMRLDYQNYLSKKKFKEYKGIYTDFGWSCMKNTRFGGIQYWQTETNDYNEIFSDRQSKANYYKRLMNYSAILGIPLLIFSLNLYRDSGIYLTEGLWSMEGSLFWIALVFETPFVLLRLSPFIMGIMLAINSYNAYRNYSMLKEK